MPDVTVSFRVDGQIHKMMKLNNDINWSSVIRKAVKDKLERMHKIDRIRAQIAAKRIDDMAKKNVFDKDDRAVEIIRKWRDKRR